MSVLPTTNEFVVPADATSLDGFRRWRTSRGEDAPRVDFIGGDLWVDMNPQSFRSHLPVTTAINAILWQRAQDTQRGRYYGDGAWLTNVTAEISTEPDGVLVLYETFRQGRVHLAPDSESELQGAPDAVLEVVSASSVRKDTQVLRTKYAQAGIPEFWLVDARPEEPSFQILTLVDGAYTPVVPNAEGFVASPVWAAAFRLRRVTDPLGQPDYRLDVRE